MFNADKGWQEQRRFLQSTLREFGFGKSNMEVIINEEIKYLMDAMDKMDGRGSDVSPKSSSYFFLVDSL